MKLNYTFYSFFVVVEAFKSTELLTYFTKLVVSHLNLPRLLFFLRLSDALLRNTIQAFLKHDHGDKSLIIMIVNKWLIINAMDLENIILFKDRIASDSLLSTSLFCANTQKKMKRRCSGTEQPQCLQGLSHCLLGTHPLSRLLSGHDDDVMILW